MLWPVRTLAGALELLISEGSISQTGDCVVVSHLASVGVVRHDER